MRRLLTALVTTIALLGLAGCSLFEDSDREKIEKIIDKEGGFAVFLSPNVTEPQKTAIEQELSGLPEVTTVTFESSDEAYRKFKELWADDPKFVESVNPDSLPPSFKVRMTGAEATRALRDSESAARLNKLPGVTSILFNCMDYDECKKLMEEVES
ncbi:permease-like cell division protein FtsX [Actinoplanes solisilvae]|uniref:permease-like cell division protein FtsX n=1 Tax=Actinoplanes solisilvae TaxID=2486853 RepID=UPI000FDB7759|nr:permease-like cell division protein FtsX [Actinoplanes solisilvae]